MINCGIMEGNLRLSELKMLVECIVKNSKQLVFIELPLTEEEEDPENKNMI